jgi:hypothetical protein
VAEALTALATNTPAERALTHRLAAYHEAKLAELVTHVAGEIDRFRDDDLKPFHIDRVLFQYSRAGKELWKHCNPGNVEVTATLRA